MESVELSSMFQTDVSYMNQDNDKRAESVQDED